MLNICGEWNAHSHYLPAVRSRFNQTLFGAAFGAAALIQFLRGGVDAEIVWTGTDDSCGYGILNPAGEPTPLYHAKRMCASHVRYGDSIRFPIRGDARLEWDAVVACDPRGRKSLFLVRLVDRPGTLRVGDVEPSLADGGYVLRLDAATAGRPVVVSAGSPAIVEMEGYGVAVATHEVESDWESR
jgi:hypothetical protein